MNKYSWAVKPDANGFDEIRIVTVPRFKESGLSGDEWRISMQINFYRKGEIVFSSGCGSKIEDAAGLVYARLLEAQDNGKGYYAGDGKHCDQEGCNELGKFVMRIKIRYCCGGGMCGQKKEYQGDPQYRLFCEKHKHRGDSDLEDNDLNYELIEEL